MIKPNYVSLGARIPADLKKVLTDYCDRNGIKMQFFVTEAVREKLQEIRQENSDIQLARERLQDAEFLEEDGLKDYLKKRSKK